MKKLTVAKSDSLVCQLNFIVNKKDIKLGDTDDAYSDSNPEDNFSMKQKVIDFQETFEANMLHLQN